MESSTLSQPEASVGVLSSGWSPSQPRILLVDDDHDLCSLNVELLVESGYHVDTARDGASGWRALNNQPPLRCSDYRQHNARCDRSGTDQEAPLRRYDAGSHLGVRNGASRGVNPNSVVAD
jgi:CheY-like chemotaxis protein